MEILIFGSGCIYQSRKECLKGMKIKAIIDNDPKKQGGKLDDILITGPENISKYTYDFIVIMSLYRKEIKTHLLNLGIPESKILDFTRIGEIAAHNLPTVVLNHMGGDIKNTYKPILLVTHEMSNTGAPMVLLYLARIFKSNGFSPIVLSPNDGELKADFMKSGISVVIVPDISPLNHQLMMWMKEFCLIWLNTSSYFYLLEPLKKLNRPIIWWLHEGISTCKYFLTEDFPDCDTSLISVYGVGRIALEAFESREKRANIKNLLYGIPDFYIKKSETIRRNKTVVFAVIATVTRRKAQDIFIDAIKKIPLEEQKKGQFWIIGSRTDAEFDYQLKLSCKDCSQIVFMNACSHAELELLYEKIDVIVCPSREDPMPVTLAEGMMNYKTCIISDSTGTADLITDKKNGLIFKSKDAAMLAEKIGWIMKNTEKLESIGTEARKIYEENFAMDIFTEHIEWALRYNRIL